MVGPKLEDGPKTTVDDAMTLNGPATKQERSAKLIERGARKAARIEERIERAKQILGSERSHLTNQHAKTVLHRERVGNELRFAMSRDNIEHLNWRIKHRIMKIRREYTPANPRAPA